MTDRILSSLVAGVLAVAIAFGAAQAYAGRAALARDECDDCEAIQWNWCAPSVGLCTECCEFCGYPLGGFCHSTKEVEAQGCECIEDDAAARAK
jgi:hypothetical protein